MPVHRAALIIAEVLRDALEMTGAPGQLEGNIAIPLASAAEELGVSG